jgi:hypothetical protein
MTRDEMINVLRTQTARVVFTKIDGDTRDMMCTLGEEFIPEDKRPKGTGRVPPESVIRAYDVNKQEWRAFRVENVVSFSY